MEFIEMIKVILLGIVEGITEWLPISSTGHMLLFDAVLPLQVSAAFRNMFIVVIQLGAILAVVVLYFPKLWPFSKKEKYWIDRKKFSLWFKILVACVPAGIVGILFEDTIDRIFENYVVIALALIIYGVLFIVIERRRRQVAFRYAEVTDITYQVALVIGLFQVLALIPGTSRSGATIVGAMLIGTSRLAATEFTFYLSIPVMFGASLLKLLKYGFDFTKSEILTLVLGMLTAFVVSILVIRFLVGYIKKHDFQVFGWYRIALGVIVLIGFGFFF